MDPVTGLVTAHKIPIGLWLNAGMNALKDGSGLFFDHVSDGLSFLIDHSVAGLGALPPPVFCLLVAGLAFGLRRSWPLALFALAGAALHPQPGLLARHRDDAGHHLLRHRRLHADRRAGRHPGGPSRGLAQALRPVLDLMQTLPTFVYLIPMLSLFGLGVVPGIIATVIFAVPAPIRMTQLGIASVPLPLREAGEAFGATPWQLLRKVELPHALPAIMEGLTQAIMLALSMSVIATMVGSGGLGVPVLRSLNQVRPAMGFEAGIAIVLVAVLLDRLFRRPAAGAPRDDGATARRRLPRRRHRLRAEARPRPRHARRGPRPRRDPGRHRPRRGRGGRRPRRAAGEICVLMGLSGSGKSTLLRAVNRLVRPARGSVTVSHAGRGVDVCACDAATLRALRSGGVAMVFQQFALLPWRSVRDNVGMGLELRGLGRRARDRIVDEKLAMVGLERWADKHAHELSGGMQQRVGLARAFATDADILLMDEPFSALDPLIRARLQDELLELQARLKKTILFVSPRPRRGRQARQPHRHHGGRPHRPGRHRGRHRAAPRRPLRDGFRAPHEPARRAQGRHLHGAAGRPARAGDAVLFGPGLRSRRGPTGARRAPGRGRAAADRAARGAAGDGDLGGALVAVPGTLPLKAAVALRRRGAAGLAGASTATAASSARPARTTSSAPSCATEPAGPAGRNLPLASRRPSR